MSDFSTTASLTVGVDEGSLRSARQTIEDGLGTVTVDVATPDTPSTDGGTATKRLGTVRRGGGSTTTAPGGGESLTPILTAQLETQELIYQELQDLSESDRTFRDGGGGIMDFFVDTGGDAAGELIGSLPEAVSSVVGPAVGSAIGEVVGGLMPGGGGGGGGSEDVGVTKPDWVPIEVQQPPEPNWLPIEPEAPPEPGWAPIDVRRPDWQVDVDKPRWAPLTVKQPRWQIDVKRPGWEIKVTKPGWEVKVTEPEWLVDVRKPDWLIDVRNPDWKVLVKDPSPLTVADPSPLRVEDVVLPVEDKVFRVAPVGGPRGPSDVRMNPPQVKGPGLGQSMIEGAGKGMAAGAGAGIAAGVLGGPFAPVSVPAGGVAGGLIGGAGGAIAGGLNYADRYAQAQQRPTTGTIRPRRGGRGGDPGPIEMTTDVNVQSSYEVTVKPNGIREMRREIMSNVRDLHERDIRRLERELERLERALEGRGSGRIQ